MASCAGCGRELVKRSQKKYCSVECQRSADRVANIRRWLETGDAPHAGTGARHYMRQHLLQEQSGRCAICSLDNCWNGAPLNLVLDHVDGDSANNRRENLRLICPNCDSQLPTYKSRNRGKGRAWRRERYAGGKSY